MNRPEKAKIWLAEALYFGLLYCYRRLIQPGLTLLYYTYPVPMLNPEHVLVPFSCSPLPPGPWLVFAPHADDETFGMGGSLLRAKKEGLETHVIVLTDGALGGEREGLVELRQHEVQQAAKLLGLSGLQCWPEPDRGLEQSQGLPEKIAAAITDIQPASVFFPGPLEIHPDHRAAGFAVWSALQRVYRNNTESNMESKMQPQIISYEIGVQNPINFVIDTTNEIREKEAVMAVYASQNSENNYPELVVALDKGRTLSLPPEVKYAEGFFRYAEKDLQITLREMTQHIIKLYQ